MLAPLLLAASTAFWGPSGHRAIARVALDYLTPAAHAAVIELAGSDSAFIAASNWPDEIRSTLSETGPWHYVDVPIDSAAYVRARDCPTRDCVVEIIPWFQRMLVDTTAPRAARREALWYLTHFVGDIHQPLHVGERHDRGGNDVRLTFMGSDTNLHALWDSGLLDWSGWDGATLDLEVARRAALLPPPSLDVLEWAGESHDLARDRVYGLLAGDTVGEDYARAGTELVLERMAVAARRLAGLLNAALDPSSLPPSE